MIETSFISASLRRLSMRPEGPRTVALGKASCQAPTKRWCSMSVAAMYFRSLPREASLLFTAGVRATGEKTARAPDWRRTVKRVSWLVLKHEV